MQDSLLRRRLSTALLGSREGGLRIKNLFRPATWPLASTGDKEFMGSEIAERMPQPRP